MAAPKNKSENPSSARSIRSFGGLFVLLFILATICIGFATQYYLVNKQRAALSVQKLELDAKMKQNQASIAEISYLEANKNHIESVWADLRGSFPGPQRTEDLAAFAELNPERIANEFNQTGLSPGFSVSGKQAEFQRVAAAVAAIETRYPLVQFTKLSLDLPEGVEPMSLEATYLNLNSAFYMPRQ